MSQRASLPLASLAILLAAVTPTLAQAPTGNLYGTVTTPTGAPLPGVAIELGGIGAPRVDQTGAQGEFRFLNLDPGSYHLEATLEGFAALEYPSIEIRAAANTTLQLRLTPAVEETITVTSESPLLDERKIKEGTTITQLELEKIPTARDPWAVLQQTPGVMVDRINVGGNESGAQSAFTAPGVQFSENDWLIDGVQITDMSSGNVGSSPTYYDFDQFTQMEFSTGGTDVTKNTAGVSVNLITKRGTNEFRGSARLLLTDEDFGGILQQADPDISDSDFHPDQSRVGQFGDRIVRVEDFGLEGGGPLVRDQLFFWASWGKNDIEQLSADGQPDDTTLENVASRIDWQIDAATCFVASFNNGDKQKFGRGAGITRPRETTWNQRGPSALYKGGISRLFRDSLFVTGTWSHFDGGFGLQCIACIAAGSLAATSETLLDADGIWRNSFISGNSKRPAEEWKLDGSYFFNTGNTNHELKFGGRMREFEQTSSFAWPGRDLFHIDGVLFGIPDPVDLFIARRGIAGPPVELQYTSLWAQDTLTVGNLTANLGARYDLQQGKNAAARIEPNPGVPDFMPAIDFSGNDGGFDWESITPRLGLTYALGEERKTLLRASFSQFAEQLGAHDIERINPAASAYVTFLFFDGDGDDMWDGPDESFFPIDSFGIDLDDPTALSSVNVNDPGYDPELINELIVGIEHALRPQFVVGLNATYRLTENIQEERDLIRVKSTGEVRVATVADYVPDGFTQPRTLPDGRVVTLPRFALDPVFEYTGGTLRTSGDREREYLGASLTFTKRLSNRWMLRGYVNYGETEWKVPGSFLRFNDPNASVNDGDRDGDLFVTDQVSGPQGNVALQTSWQFNVNGMVQIAPERPWGFNVAANVFGRQGYPIPYETTERGADGRIRPFPLFERIDDFRNDDILVVDVRLEKELATRGAVGLTLGLDVFNLFNQNYVLERNRRLNQGTGDFLLSTLSPRIFRIGARLSWK